MHDAHYPINFVVKHPNRLACFADGPPLGGVRNLLVAQPVSRSASPLIEEPQSNMAAIWKQRMSSGGAERDRTADPLLAKQVLSQLSYSPTSGRLRSDGGPG